MLPTRMPEFHSEKEVSVSKMGRLFLFFLYISVQVELLDPRQYFRGYTKQKYLHFFLKDTY